MAGWACWHPSLHNKEWSDASWYFTLTSYPKCTTTLTHCVKATVFFPIPPETNDSELVNKRPPAPTLRASPTECDGARMVKNSEMKRLAWWCGGEPSREEARRSVKHQGSLRCCAAAEDAAWMSGWRQLGAQTGEERTRTETSDRARAIWLASQGCYITQNYLTTASSAPYRAIL